jgi:hypothetical protein
LSSAKRHHGPGGPVTLDVVRDGPFRGSQALAGGLLTPNQLYGPRHRRLFRDVFVPATLEPDLATRSRAAFLLVRGRRGLLAGYSAAALLGADCAPHDAPAEVLVPHYMRGEPGLRVSYGAAAGVDLMLAGGCRVTAPLRTAWDLARRLPLVEAVIAVDALARAGGFAPAELLTRRRSAPGARNCRRLDEVVALSDPRAESPRETRLRVGLVRAGLPAPEVQYRIEDEHGFVLARVDLGYPCAKLAIEYDGATHFTVRRARLDRERDGLLASHGWQTLRLAGDDIGIAMRQTANRVAELLALRTR